MFQFDDVIMHKKRVRLYDMRNKSMPFMITTFYETFNIYSSKENQAITELIVNKANLRDLIAVTGLVILLKLDLNS